MLAEVLVGRRGREIDAINEILGVCGVVERGIPSGVYHATNAGSCSWFEFASEVLRLAGVEAAVEPIQARDWKSPTRRPANSVLENRALAELGLDVMPEWRDALARYLAARDDDARPAT